MSSRTNARKLGLLENKLPKSSSHCQISVVRDRFDSAGLEEVPCECGAAREGGDRAEIGEEDLRARSGRAGDRHPSGRAGARKARAMRRRRGDRAGPGPPSGGASSPERRPAPDRPAGDLREQSEGRRTATSASWMFGNSLVPVIGSCASRPPAPARARTPRCAPGARRRAGFRRCRPRARSPGTASRPSRTSRRSAPRSRPRRRRDRRRARDWTRRAGSSACCGRGAARTSRAGRAPP